MSHFFKRFLQTLLAISLILACVAAVKHEEITRLLAVNSLFSKEKIVHNFSHMDEAFLSTKMLRNTAPVSRLNVAPSLLPKATQAWVKDRAITSLVVLKDAELRHESYYLDTSPEDLRIGWSVSKSFLSALLGIILDQGKIESLEDPVDKYAPSLRGSAYKGVTIRNVLNMASGVKFNEDYLDFNSDINQMGRVLALGGSMDEFTAKLQSTFVAPGKQWQYVSIDTHVISMVLRGATGRTIPDLMQEHIIQPMGLEAAPYYVTDGEHVAFVLGGLNMRTRDYARFGQMYLQGGRWNGRQIVPENWVAASTVPSAPTSPQAQKYGYQWWMAPDAPKGEYYARGVYGQYIYINKLRGVVIAITASDTEFNQNGVTETNLFMFRKIAEALD